MTRACVGAHPRRLFIRIGSGRSRNPVASPIVPRCSPPHKVFWHRSGIVMYFHPRPHRRGAGPGIAFHRTVRTFRVFVKRHKGDHRNEQQLRCKTTSADHAPSPARTPASSGGPAKPTTFDRCLYLPRVQLELGRSMLRTVNKVRRNETHLCGTTDRPASGPRDRGRAWVVVPTFRRSPNRCLGLEPESARLGAPVC